MQRLVLGAAAAAFVLGLVLAFGVRESARVAMPRVIYGPASAPPPIADPPETFAIASPSAPAGGGWREPPRSMQPMPQPCRVTFVFDGDTIACANGTRARLRGVDSPERGEPRHREATAALAAMLARCGGRVVLIPHHMTRGRIAASVLCGGVDVGVALDRAGWSKPVGARR